MKKLILLFLFFVGVQGIYILNHTTATLSEARYHLAAAASENLVFFAGGMKRINETSGYYTPSDRVDIYNITSNIWTNATLSEARYALVAAVSENLVLFAGGMNQDKMPSDRVDIYNITSSTWTNATLSIGRYELAATASNNLVFFAGGMDKDNKPSNRVDIYNITSSIWTNATLSIGRYGLAAAASNNLVFFAGGMDKDDIPSIIVNIYNITSNIWTNATLSEARYGLVAAASNNLVFFAGGMDSGIFTSNMVDIYNIRNIWTTATLSEVRGCLAAAVSNDLVFFAGGKNSQSVPSNRVDIYNITSSKWTTAALSEARYALAAAATENLVFFAGGMSQGIYETLSNIVDIFYVVNNTDVEISTTSPIPRVPTSPPYSVTSGSPLSSPTSTVSSSSLPYSGTPGFSTNSSSFNPSIDLDLDSNSSENPIEYSSSENPMLLILIILTSICFVMVLLIVVILIILLINKHKKNKLQKLQNQSCISSNTNSPTEIYLKNDKNNSSEPIVELDPNEELNKDINSTIASELTISTQVTLTTNTIQDTVQTISSTVNILPKSQISYSDLLLEKSLGKGAFGEVFFGHWKGIPVAMKVCKSKSKLEEFLHEMKLITKLPPHPNVVQVYGVCLDNTSPVIVMEYCENGSLDNIIYKQNLDRKKIFDIIKQIANGMLHIHKHDIVHCDLAARNILLTSSFHAKISDFGMAKVLEKTGGIRGSNMLPALWCSPETLRSGIFTKKSDVWSFGITVYEIISGNEPFHDRQDIAELIKSIRGSSLTPEIPENCPQEIGELMKMCWEPESRRPGFEEICKFLNSLDS
jgi:predicted Ser/Thr protein kinase